MQLFFFSEKYPTTILNRKRREDMPTVREMEEHLELTRSRGYVVAKSNEIVQKSRYSLSLSQQKLLSFIISLIKPVARDENGNDIMPAEIPLEHGFNIRQYARIMMINDSNGKLYNAVKDDVQALADCSVWVPVEGSEKKESIVRWVDTAEIAERSGNIRIKLHPSIVPYLYNLKEKFTSYELCEIFPFRSRYSIRMYELCRSHLYERSFVIGLEELKRYFMVDDNAYYDDFKKFSQKILKKSIDEINMYTSMQVSVEKDGRPVKRLMISMREGKPERETG